MVSMNSPSIERCSTGIILSLAATGIGFLIAGTVTHQVWAIVTGGSCLAGTALTGFIAFQILSCTDKKEHSTHDEYNQQA